MQQSEATESDSLHKYLSPIGAWSLALGAGVGWGAFMMPGVAFLPSGGPLGTAIGILLGAFMMIIVAKNYHLMLNRWSDCGGIFTYTKKVFGYDHGFLCSWFLCLTYISMIWANATALALVARYTMGNLFKIGFHYQVAGYDIYLGEALLCDALILFFGLLCIWHKRLAGGLQIFMAAVLSVGILCLLSAAVAENYCKLGCMLPAFVPGVEGSTQIFRIIALVPWAFVGFESISHSVEEFSFSPKKTFKILTAAIIGIALSYIFLVVVTVSAIPGEYPDWVSYVADLQQLSGIKAVPTFWAAQKLLGGWGIFIMAFALLSALGTSIIANMIAASRLMKAMAKENILPDWFGIENECGAPGNSILFLTLISLAIPFLGRTAISWQVDISTVGATVAYGYTSAAVYIFARERSRKERGKKLYRYICVSGVAGIVISIFFSLFLLIPNLFSGSALAKESYLILAIWSMLGILFFRSIFANDKMRRFGKSVFCWIALLSLIFFTSMMWMRQTMNTSVEQAVSRISWYYYDELKEQGIEWNEDLVQREESFLKVELGTLHSLLFSNSLVHSGLMVLSICILFSIYVIMKSREKGLEIEKVQAEKSSKAKSIFLSNISHDLRTPMNAIIGYTELARRGELSAAEMRTYLDKIDHSSKYLLSLINDVLEMSRIESGKIVLEPSNVDLVQSCREVCDLFAVQMENKQLSFSLNTEGVSDRFVVCDKKRLNRVLLNLLSNAYKFTPKGGAVSVTLNQTSDPGLGDYELKVKDTGIGMSPDFVSHIFTAFEREQTTAVNETQGTGLGMAITKNIIDLMHGSIEVVTAVNEGSEFIVRLSFPLAEDGGAPEPAEAEAEAAPELDFSKIRLLLVEDNDINREIANMILSEEGFMLDNAENGKIGVDMLAASSPGYYGAVLMDIQMPVMNGYEAAKAIRALPNKKLASVPIIAMTANAFAEDVQMAKEAGMNDHLAKPLDIDRMLQVIKAALLNKEN
ncbi:amino acid permease [bacterium]|nr:amino acid permease [bacterium]